MNNQNTEAPQQGAVAVFPIALNVNLLPETIALIQNADQLAAGLAEVKISTPEDYVTAADQLAKVKGLAKKLEDDRAATSRPISKALQDVRDYYGPKLNKLAIAEGALKSGIIAFEDEAERKRQLAEAAANERARKESEKLAERAEAAAAAGKDEKAAVLADQAANVVAAPVATVVTAVTGLSRRVTYKAEVKDVGLLVRAAAAPMLFKEAGGDPAKLMALVTELAMKNVPLTMVKADDKALNKAATALKEAMDYPGVKVVTEKGLGSRSADPFITEKAA